MIPIDERYFTWLYSKIGHRKVPIRGLSYRKLAYQLYTKEFLWFVPNDDNRAEEGIELRKVFLDETGTQYPGHEWMEMTCSILELLIGMSHRLSFIDDRPAHIWFWEMLDNVDLTYANDDEYGPDTEEDVEQTFDRVIWRLYEQDGAGGLFPLHHAHEDQRKIELWYQMSAYINERMFASWHSK